jgi:hypothetical protein
VRGNAMRLQQAYRRYVGPSWSEAHRWERGHC